MHSAPFLIIMRLNVRTVARLSLAFLAALVFALVVGLNSVLARTLLSHAVSGLTGAEMRADNVTFAGSLHRFTATNFELHAANGTTILRAPRAEFDLSEKPPRIVLDRPEAVVARSEAGSIVQLLSRLRTQGGSLRITGGTLRLANALDVESIDGTFSASAGKLAYDVTAGIVDGGRSYPLRGHGGDGDIGIAHEWTAPVLPLGPLVEATAP
ncbi:MAG: hypothetical protein JO349_03470, partial [Candidatus Eremiobacteraeota bacterium]|nr:hypothetical protein [Candidatus Eremiobacteraeota bacterium]